MAAAMACLERMSIRAMKTISLADAQARLAELVDRLAEGPVLLLHKGRPCAALVGLD